MSRVLAVISAAACLLVCASCATGGHPSPLPTVATTNLPPATGPTEPTGVPTCGSPGGPQVWAEDVSATGRVLWRTALTTQSQTSADVVQPLVAGEMAVFADSTTVY